MLLSEANPFVAPALSMNRIEINYGKYNTIQISPKELNLFVNELQTFKLKTKLKGFNLYIR
ncbi:PH domain-containing protein [Neobacillus niacini]|uniref:PH domain-containing protein n=1 Tax=Neobacillus niacini TaxID=86668 RepID=UPI0005EDF74B|nr:PH domain-containing protein [Neobacillus niacini]